MMVPSIEVIEEEDSKEFSDTTKMEKKNSLISNKDTLRMIQGTENERAPSFPSREHSVVSRETLVANHESNIRNMNTKVKRTETWNQEELEEEARDVVKSIAFEAAVIEADEDEEEKGSALGSNPSSFFASDI